MADLQTIALGIVQANALLLPVVVLLVRFVIGDPSGKDSIQSEEKRLLQVAIPTLVFLSVSGLLGAFGILTGDLQRVALFGSVFFLILGFGGLSLFTILTVWYTR